MVETCRALDSAVAAGALPAQSIGRLVPERVPEGYDQRASELGILLGTATSFVGTLGCKG